MRVAAAGQCRATSRRPAACLARWPAARRTPAACSELLLVGHPTPPSGQGQRTRPWLPGYRAVAQYFKAILCVPLLQDPAGDGDTRNLLGDSQRASRLRRRRMFLRSQPFFWQPHGQAYRRAACSLLARAAAAHALLSTLSLLFLLRACLSWRSAPGAPPLGEQTLEDLWSKVLPRDAPQWLQGMLLLAVQQATALGFTVAYGVWRCAAAKPTCAASIA